MRVWSHSDSHPANIQTHQPAPLAAGWLQNISQMKHGNLPNSLDSVPPAITERAIHHDGSKAAAQIVAAITKKKKKKCYCLPCKDCLPAKLLRHPYSVPYSPAQSPEAKLTAQILGRTSGSFGSPAVMHLFCKVRLTEEQAKLLPAQVGVATITIIPWEQGGPFCMAVPPRNRRLWRSVTYRPLAKWERAVGGCK